MEFKIWFPYLVKFNARILLTILQLNTRILVSDLHLNT